MDKIVYKKEKKNDNFLFAQNVRECQVHELKIG